MGGHLNPAVAAVRRAVRVVCADLDPGQRVLVACSGGADSMALAAATVFEAQAAGWLAGAAVVDHQLFAESGRVASEVGERLRALGCDPVDVVAVRVATRGGPEAAARDARYTALSSLAQRHRAVVLLGHTLDDQAETVLLGLARGSGLRSLSGMTPARGLFRRPLLGVTRQQTSAACTAMGLVVWQDPSNADGRFARTRVRHRVLPVLEEALGPGVAAALARTAALARADADALEELADNLTTRVVGPDGAASVDALAEAPAALRRRVLRKLALAAGCPAGDLSAAHLEAMDSLITDWHGQQRIDIPGSLSVRREGGRLRLSPRVGG